jgi:hypothetical protein
MRTAILALSVLLLAGCAPGPRPGERPLAANPSAVIAAELAFARLAQEKGQWTAFRETAADDAQMFIPQRVKAADWLKGRANPAVGVTWQPHAVHMSCDGTAAVTTGAWQGQNGAYGYFTTIWRRQNDGSFRWVLEHRDAITAAPRAAPEFITAKVADCKVSPPANIMALDVDEDRQSGSSDDGTLKWTTSVFRDASRTLVVRRQDGDKAIIVIDDRVVAPPPPMLDVSVAPQAKTP